MRKIWLHTYTVYSDAVLVQSFISNEAKSRSLKEKNYEIESICVDAS